MRERRQSPRPAGYCPTDIGAGYVEISARSLHSSPLRRLRFWCRIVSDWRQARGRSVPPRLLMALSEAECAAALAEVAGQRGSEGASIAAFDTALEQVRRKVST